MKKTLILGASTNPARYSFMAANRLLQYGHPIVLLGLKEGQISGNQILTNKPKVEDIDTITLYIGVEGQYKGLSYQYLQPLVCLLIFDYQRFVLLLGPVKQLGAHTVTVGWLP